MTEESLNENDKIRIQELSLAEIKSQYKIGLVDRFDDHKKKSQLLLFTASLSLTLPITSDLLISNLINSNILITSIFLIGMTSILISIISLIYSLKPIKLQAPQVESMIECKDTNSYEEVLEATVKKYIEVLVNSLIRLKKKEKYVSNAESFLLLGIILEFGILMISFVIYGV